MEALGPIHSPVVVAVVLEDMSVSDWCGAKSDWAVTKAADQLRAGLSRLAEHYGRHEPAAA